MLCLSGFELYSRWVPLTCNFPENKRRLIALHTLTAQAVLNVSFH